MARMKVLILNQTFYPDVVSTAQHAADLASALAGQGHEVTVLASRRGYDNPAAVFAKREQWKGVNIVRIGSTGLGQVGKMAPSGGFCELHSERRIQYVALGSLRRNRSNDFTAAHIIPGCIGFAS